MSENIKMLDSRGYRDELYSLKIRLQKAENSWKGSDSMIRDGKALLAKIAEALGLESPEPGCQHRISKRQAEALVGKSLPETTGEWFNLASCGSQVIVFHRWPANCPSGVAQESYNINVQQQ